MKRQRSILSFFQKPSPAGPCSNSTESEKVAAVSRYLVNERDGIFDASKNPAGQNALETPAEATGIDTPPEKVPRRVLASGEAAGGSSKFSRIMHKFAKTDDEESGRERNQANTVSSNASFGAAQAFGLPKRHETGQFQGKRNVCSDVRTKELNGSTDALNGPAKFCGFPKHQALGQLQGKGDAFSFVRSIDRGSISESGPDDDILGPETPGMRPCVPRLKRVQEDCTQFRNKIPLHESSKRLKLLQEPTCGEKKNVEETDVGCKFEWLNPSRIKDANGRRPDDPLYDKKTLYIPPDAFKKMSASQKQYWGVKSQYMDILVFFKVGKFYELYEQDAEIGHKELNWKLTMSGVGKCRQVGIPESGIDDAVEKLVARGFKVGRMEQLETSDQAKARGSNSVIPRKLVHVSTPSTSNEGNIGPDAVHLLAIKEVTSGLDNGSSVYGFAFVDCAALRFWVGSINDDASCAALGALLMQVSPKEVVYESRGLTREAQKALRKYTLTGSAAVQLTPELLITDIGDASEFRNMIDMKGYFKGSSNLWNHALDASAHRDITLCALGGLIGHLSRLMLDDVLRNGDIHPYHVYRGCLRIDGQTMVNLEIFSNNADGGSSGTLYKHLDNCVTPSGKRLLRSWICHPLKDVGSINNRLDVVECLIAHAEIVQIVGQYLRKLPDLERLLGRIKSSVQSPASILPALIGKKVLKLRVKSFGSLVKGLRSGIDLVIHLQKESDLMTLLGKVSKLPLLSGKEGIDLFLSQFEAAIDSDFPNYQNQDMTEENAETLTILIELLVERATQLSEVIHAINCIDVLRSFATIVSLSCGNMARPIIVPESKSMTPNQERKSPTLKVQRLWHPFALGTDESLPVPNDILLGKDTGGYHPCSVLLTGPNMGGKSTIMRATCLAVILAQLGCYVPCETCELSLVDIIFTRLGATDRIMTGESTFLIECTETASVLQNATRDSLVILDELGRGTSTFDGYAIAYSVFRHLVEEVSCRLLFATHYHPLTKEFASHPHVKLQHMACAFRSKPEESSSDCRDSDLVFLYRLVDGASPESYGLQVALMAGIPKQVVESASVAGRAMKQSIRENFRTSERRREFSTLHEDWLKALVCVSVAASDDVNADEDAYDTLFCLWHELKCSYGKQD